MTDNNIVLVRSAPTAALQMARGSLVLFRVPRSTPDISDHAPQPH